VTATHHREVLSGDWSQLVVFFGGTAWDGNRFPDQHIAERLARYSPVLYVDPPLSIVRAPRWSGAAIMRPRLQRLGPSLLRLTPLAPPAPLRAAVRGTTYRLMRRATCAMVRRLGGDVRAVVVASLNPMLSTWPGAVRVLYGTDDFAAGAELLGVDGNWLRQREQQQLAAADLVVAVSEPLADKWRAMGAEVTVISNGCDDELFSQVDDAPWPADVTLPGPIAGFVGHLSERIDLALLEAVAAAGHSLVLVGPRQPTFGMARMDELLERPNVTWVGPKPFESLPSYLRTFDVGLLPYADSAFNRASFPLKTLEYLAAGRPAVATDLPAIRSLNTDLIDVATGPEDFAAAVGRALRSPQDPGLTARRQEVAGQHSWNSRATEFADLIGLRSGSGRTASGT